jgi:tRNA(Ile2) C34 agmatinyltransferase TiaS
MTAEDERCCRCGTDRPERSLTWVRESADGRTTWLCPECARRHVRDIEAKLAPEWW